MSECIYSSQYLRVTINGQEVPEVSAFPVITQHEHSKKVELNINYYSENILNKHIGRGVYLEVYADHPDDEELLAGGIFCIVNRTIYADDVSVVQARYTLVQGE